MTQAGEPVRERQEGVEEIAVSLEVKEKCSKQFFDFCESRQLSDFCQIVQVVHADGSVFVFHHASLWHSAETYEDEWTAERPMYLGVATEHCGNHFFHTGDLLDWWTR